MTEAQAIEAIAQRWKDGWEALQPTVPYTFEDEFFEAPTVWARVTVRHSVRQQISAGDVGTRRFEHRGNVFVQLFGDVDRGRAQLAGLADNARSVFEAKRIVVDANDDKLTLYSASSRESPTDGRWAQHTVTVPFVYYQLA